MERLCVFAELHGIVIFTPERIEPPVKTNLLHLYTTTDAGDRVVQEGICLPILDIDEGDYTVVIREAREASYLRTPPLVRSSGWILGTPSGTLAVCGAGYLSVWNPEHPRIQRLQVTPGWFGVEVRGGRNQPGTSEEEWVYEVVLTAAKSRPVFSGNLGQRMSLLP